MSEYRLRLNNYLQANPAVGPLTRQESSEGPSSNATWTVVAFLKGVEYGRGVARTKAEATEIAAERVLTELNVPH
ncbi:uncharacterized protein B0H18DRAFT_1122184 [Fomitopsis serialis]|uniref:uncharacterized protein n=1 Tax=Fomitopsis serialis TaxID=139415 RepID=UPI002008208A|nr:uncharacterized protein B0H18DRAFT_1122184 [Neoantrodia serialis]KAH9920090.1 hypothetical protein B0H18DRAFT_1122184 [Neoantrodia serialis]